MGALIHPTYWKWQHERAGRIIWASGLGELDEPVAAADEVTAAQLWTPNALADEGEQDILSVYFRGGTQRTVFYIRLWDDTPVDTDTLASLQNEVTGTGYAAVSINANGTDFPTLALDSGDYQVVSVGKVFTASGTWSAATYATLSTTSDNSGKLIAYNYLGATRSLIATDTLTATISVKLG